MQSWNPVLPAQRARCAINAAAGQGSGSLRDRQLGLVAVGQIDWGGDYLLKAVASGPMHDLVKQHLGDYAFLVPLTARKRRQVWFAVLAAMPVPREEVDRAGLLNMLLLSSNRDLLRSAYGSVPPGFELALDRFGETARHPEVYLELFRILGAKNRESLVKEYVRMRDEDVYLMSLLPEMRGASTIAGAFSSVDRFKEFLRAYEYITGSPPTNTVWKEIKSGAKPFAILLREYNERPFGHTPAIVDPDFEYINSVAALESSAVLFRNCLASQSTRARQGSHQFYIWKADPAVVLCLVHDSISWVLSEARLHSNERLPGKIRTSLDSKLSHLGIRSWGNEDILGSMFHDPDFFGDPDFFDEEGDDHH